MFTALRDLGIIGIVSAALMEIGLRVYNPIYVPLRADEIQLPVNMVVKQENVNNKKVDRDRVMTYNALGFRGPNYPEDPANFVKIFTVGGSTTACVSLTDGRTWPDHVAKMLTPPGTKKIWLNNAGFDGHSTFGHRIMLDTHISKFKSDFILYLIGINDVGRGDLNEFDVGFFQVEGRTLKKRIIGSSELLSTLQVLYRTYRAYDMGLDTRYDDDLTQMKKVHLSEQESAAFIKSHHDTYLPAYRERVRVLIERTKQLGAVPVLVTQPGLMGSGVDPTTGVELDALDYRGQNIPGALMWQALELYNDVVRKLAHDEGVPLIDAARLMPKDSELYFDWIHYSNKGAERMASIIRDGLQPLIDSGT